MVQVQMAAARVGGSCFGGSQRVGDYETMMGRCVSVLAVCVTCVLIAIDDEIRFACLTLR